MNKLKTDLEIGEVLRQLQRELIESEKKRLEEGLLPLFETKECELELRCVIRDSIGAEGKVDIKLFAISGKATDEEELTHILRVKFEVIRQDNQLSVPEAFEKPTGRRPRKE